MSIIGKVLYAAVLACVYSAALWLQPAVMSGSPAAAYRQSTQHYGHIRHERERRRSVRRAAHRVIRSAPPPVPRAPDAASTILAFPQPPIAARAAILVDLRTGRVLFSKNADERLPMASTTKITTAVLTLDQSRLNDIVRISHRAASIGESTMALADGERLTVRQLLYGLLLNSGNDAAIALAEHVAGTEERFVARMNALAQTLGMHNTHYVTAHGLDAPGHFSSARDLAIVARYAMRDPRFRRIVSTISYHVPATRHNGEHWLATVNKVMLWYPGVDGIKPGDTDNAGLCQVVSLNRDGHQLIAVVLNTPTLIFDIRNLLNYGLGDFRWIQGPAWWDSPADSATGGSRYSGWLYFFGAGHYIRGAFLHYFQTHGGLQPLGYPRTEAFMDGGRLVQYFEAGELAYDTRSRAAYPIDLGTTEARRFARDGLIRDRALRVAPVFADAYRRFGGVGVLGLPLTGTVSQGGASVQVYQYGELVMSAQGPVLAPLGDTALRARGWLPAWQAGTSFPWSIQASFETSALPGPAALPARHRAKPSRTPHGAIGPRR